VRKHHIAILRLNIFAERKKRHGLKKRRCAKKYGGKNGVLFITRDIIYYSLLILYTDTITHVCRKRVELSTLIFVSSASTCENNYINTTHWLRNISLETGIYIYIIIFAINKYRAVPHQPLLANPAAAIERNASRTHDGGDKNNQKRYYNIILCPSVNNNNNNNSMSDTPYPLQRVGIATKIRHVQRQTDFNVFIAVIAVVDKII